MNVPNDTYLTKINDTFECNQVHACPYYAGSDLDYIRPTAFNSGNTKINRLDPIRLEMFLNLLYIPMIFVYYSKINFGVST